MTGGGPGSTEPLFSPAQLSNMLAGSSASMLSRIPCHPLDTCKARLQVRVRLLGSSPTTASAPAGGIRRELASCFRGEGVRGLYRGFGTAFWGSCPAGCLYFAGYEFAKTALGRLAGGEAPGRDPAAASEPGPAVHLAAGIIAEAVSCVLWVPIDVVKERLQTQTVLYGVEKAPYRGNLHAVSAIARQEGLRGVYRGYGATVMSFGPFSGLYFMFYERLKSLVFSAKGVDPDRPEDLPGLPALWFGACGALAGSAAALMTNPLDLAKLRIQVQRGAKAGGAKATPFHYRHMFDGLGQIVKQEGAGALWKGALARCAFQAPATAISIASFEQFRIFYSRTIFRDEEG
jgi:hypothetical protein